MKRSALLLILIWCSTSYAQEIKSGDVPSVVTDSFKRMYPHAEKVKWEKEKENYEAEFDAPGPKGKEERSVVMGTNGNFIHEEVEISVQELPSSIPQYVKDQMGGKKISEACRVNLPTGEIQYEIKVDGKDHLFDSNGKFLLTENDQEKEKKK